MGGLAQLRELLGVVKDEEKGDSTAASWDQLHSTLLAARFLEIPIALEQRVAPFEVTIMAALVASDFKELASTLRTSTNFSCLTPGLAPVANEDT